MKENILHLNFILCLGLGLKYGWLEDQMLIFGPSWAQNTILPRIIVIIIKKKRDFNNNSRVWYDKSIISIENCSVHPLELGLGN